jgi:hypothetical protein
LEGQNEARLQAYAQQQAARQAVPLQASQPRNAYGWLAQRIGNVFSPAAYAAPIPQRPAPPSLPSKADLNKQMRLMADALKFGILDPTKTEAENNKLQDVPVFTDADYKYPTGDSTVSDVTRVIKGALFNSRGDRLTLQEVEQLRAKVQSLSFSPEELKTLGLARRLNDIINQYGKKDDAMATALGIQVIANYNTRDGVLNKKGFKEDLARFYIDQKWVINLKNKEAILSSVGSKTLHNVGDSPLAQALFGRDRVGAYGWKEELQEKGNPEYNQAHHLAAYIIATFDYGDTIAMKEAYLVDENHPYDIKVSLIATNIANLLLQNEVNLNNLWKAIYDRIKDN